MQPFEKIHEYSETVCDQIQWEKAHPIITEEIENHLIDQRDAYITQGEHEEEATDHAITQMGDPIIIGTELERTHRPKSQRSMMLLIAVLVCIGVIIPFFDHFIFRSLFISYYRDILHSLFYAIIGLGLMTGAYFMDFTWLGRHPKKIYLSLLLYITVAFVLKQLEFSRRLFYYVDFISLLLPLGFACVVYSARNKGYKGIITCGIAFLLPAAMLLFMRFRSEFMLFAISSFVILCIAIAKGWFKVKKFNAYLLVFIPTAICILLAVIVVLNDSHKLEVVRSAFNLSYDPFADDTFGKHIKATLTGSKFIGRGVMPVGAEQEPALSVFCLLTSLIFYTGWISVILIIGAFLFFIVKGFRLCLKQKSFLALLVSMSVMMTFTIQIINYILFNLGFDLFSIISLPFIMQFKYYVYFTNLALSGVMLSVFRTGYVVKDKYINTEQKNRYTI